MLFLTAEERHSRRCLQIHPLVVAALLVLVMRRTPAKDGGTEAAKDATDQREKTRNHYAIMDLHDFASSSDAKKAYHRLALKWHPDRQIGLGLPEEQRKGAEDRFKVSPSCGSKTRSAAERSSVSS